MTEAPPPTTTARAAAAGSDRLGAYRGTARCLPRRAADCRTHRRPAGPAVAGQGVLRSRHDAAHSRAGRAAIGLGGDHRADRRAAAADRGLPGPRHRAADAGADAAGAGARRTARRASVLGGAVRLVRRAGGGAAVAGSPAGQGAGAERAAAGGAGDGGSGVVRSPGRRRCIAWRCGCGWQRP